MITIAIIVSLCLGFLAGVFANKSASDKQKSLSDKLNNMEVRLKSEIHVVSTGVKSAIRNTEENIKTHFNKPK